MNQTSVLIMKTNILAGLSVLIAGSVLAAESTPKDAVLAAAKKLGENQNYAWKSVTAVPEDAPFKPGPTEGKTEKDGFTWLTMGFEDTETKAVLKGAKGAHTNQHGER